MPTAVTATEVNKLLGLFSPFLSATDSAKLGDTVAALDWTRRQPLPQRRFGITPTAATADRSREQQLQKRLATLQPQTLPQRLQRETSAVTPALLWSRFTVASAVVGFLEVRSGSDDFGWSRDGGEKLRWSSSEGHRLALAAATAADTDSCYCALLRWMELHLTEAVWNRRQFLLTVPERERVTLSLQTLLCDCGTQSMVTG